VIVTAGGEWAGIRSPRKEKAWGFFFRFFPMEKRRSSKKRHEETISTNALRIFDRDIHPFQSSRTETTQWYAVTTGGALAVGSSPRC
jgi:hypothetical protein